jgi:hypothetical protein
VAAVSWPRPRRGRIVPDRRSLGLAWRFIWGIAYPIIYIIGGARGSECSAETGISTHFDPKNELSPTILYYTPITFFSLPNLTPVKSKAYKPYFGK